MPYRLNPLSELVFDRADYNRNLRLYMENLFKEAMTAFVNAAAPKIPSLTGQARASVLAAAAALGLHTSHGTDTFPHSTNRARDRERMLRAGNSAARGFGMGTAWIDITRDFAAAFFDNSQFTSAHNNYNYFEKHDEVWGAIDAALAAFRDYIEKHLDPPQFVEYVHYGR